MTADYARGRDRKWLRLDTAALLYPAIENGKRPEIFRLSMTLKEQIDPPRLQRALETSIERFPYFQVSLEKGFFWFYFESNHRTPRIQPDTQYPCSRILRRKSDRYMFRVLYREATVAIEFFHAITDGSGGLIFLKTLIAEYLRLGGKEMVYDEGVFDCASTPEPEESENAFRRYYKRNMKRPIREKSSFRQAGTLEPHGVLHTITGSVSVETLRKKARDLGVTMTEYVASVIVYSLFQIQREQHRGPKALRKKPPIRISVPVNMRKVLPSRTLRNYSLFVKPGIEPHLGDYTFEEVLRQVHHAMRYELSNNYLTAALCANVALELNPVIKVIPRVLKNLAIAFVYSNFGENLYSTTLSNLGPVQLPGPMRDEVSHADFVLGSNRMNYTNCTMVSFEDTMRITFSRTIRETRLEKLVFGFLVEQDIPVSIESRA